MAYIVVAWLVMEVADFLMVETLNDFLLDALHDDPRREEIPDDKRLPH